MHNLIQAKDLNDYNSELCRFNPKDMKGINGLAVQDLYSGSILKPNTHMENDMDNTTYEIQHALLDMYTEQHNKENTVVELTREQLIEQLVQERDAINLRLNDIATELSSLYTEEEKGAIVDDILSRWLRVTEQPY